MKRETSFLLAMLLPQMQGQSSQYRPCGPEIVFSYVTDNVTWAEQQKGCIFLDSSWESPNPSPLSPQFSCTSQK